MYHHINNSDNWFATSESSLNEQMTWLAANGYVSIAPSDLFRAMTSDTDLPGKPVMLTIDDGNHTDHVFAATLAQHGFRGTYFWPDTSPLSVKEMIELAAQGEIGAHTRSHTNLSTLSHADQKAEINDNLQRLRCITGQPVRSFAYPYGEFNDASSEVVRELGFDLAFNASGTPITIGDIDRFHVPRFEISNGISLEEFIIRVKAWR